MEQLAKIRIVNELQTFRAGNFKENYCELLLERMQLNETKRACLINGYFIGKKIKNVGKMRRCLFVLSLSFSKASFLSNQDLVEGLLKR